MFGNFSFTNEILSAETIEFDELTWNDCDSEDGLSSHLNYAAQHVGGASLNKLDAFSCPKFKNESLKAQEALQNTMQLLDAAKTSCTQLQDQLCDKDSYYTQREEKLQSLHRSELEEARLKYNELQKQAKDEIAGLEHQLIDRDAQHKNTMTKLRLEMNNKFTEQLQLLTAAEERERELQQRLASLDATNFELSAKCNLLEKTNAEQAQAAAESERLLNERISLVSCELEALRKRRRPSPVREREDALHSAELSHDEIAILRPSCRASLDSRVYKQRGGSGAAVSRTSLPAELQRLQNEVESLSCVLEMRQSEISKLSKQNEEMLRDADERAAMSTKISMMSAHIEMLKSELETKTEREKEYLSQLDKLQKHANHEKTKLTRLNFDKESLQYLLKERSEQLQIVEAKLSQSLNSSHSLNVSSLHSNLSNNYSSSSLAPFHMDNTASPPMSPVIKGVIEKADSVAYVLEMDDETPEVAASKMVKRASSFRSIERSPVTRRQLSLSASTAAVPTSPASTAPNPLSQSMSAASVIHSMKNTKQKRVRSRSVSIKDEDPLQATIPIESKNSLSPVRDVVCTSSPYVNKIRPRTSTMKVETILDEEQSSEGAHYKQPVVIVSTNQSAKPCHQQPRLITCDTSALSSGERLDEHMLPSHPSLHDLKVPKQCLEVKESAGEAMVSGANSEDEGCSASSDDLVSMQSSTSTDISAANARHNMLETAPNMSLEQVLLMDKINSLSGTPMEMSWSDEIIDPITAPMTALNGSSEA